MPRWQVHRPSSLQHFLRGQKLQEWRIAVLIDNGGIKVFRLNTQIALNGPRTHLKQFDQVELLDPLPASCLAALAKQAKTASRDYALVPGKTPYDLEMAKLLETRPQTIRIKDPLLFDLARFLPGLGTSTEVTHPIRDLLVASHANAEGLLRLQIGKITDRAVTYNDLLDLVKSKTIVIDQRLLQPRPTDAHGVAIGARFVIRGCHIGHQVKFMQKLKEALGNKHVVAAPMHYHLATAIKDPPGHIEYLGYAFEISHPTQFKDRKGVIAGMVGAAFLRIDGKPLPNKLWDTWIPRKPHWLDPKMVAQNKEEGEQSFVSYAKSPINGKRIGLPRRYTYKIRRLFNKDNQVEVPGSSDRPNDRKKAVRAQLVKVGFFQEKSGFPLFERYGYKSIDEFMDAWEWRFDPKTKSANVTYNAYRHEYRVVEPIAELQGGKPAKVGAFILNYVPTRRRHKPVEVLSVDDPRLYKVV